MVSIKPNQSVINSFKILEAISNSSSYIGVSQLSKETSLPKTTVFRLLETLHYLGLIKQNDNQEYTLGRAFLKYIDKVKNQEDLVSISTPFLKEFASTVGETINLGILYNNEVIYLKSIRGERLHLEFNYYQLLHYIIVLWVKFSYLLFQMKLWKIIFIKIFLKKIL